MFGRYHLTLHTFTLVVLTIFFTVGIIGQWLASPQPVIAQTSTLLTLIEWNSPSFASTPQPVNIAAEGLPLRYQIPGVNQRDFLCQIDASSIHGADGSPTVVLEDDKGNSHLIHTVTSTNTVNDDDYFHFILQTNNRHYELKEQTSYALKMNGASADSNASIRIECTEKFSKVKSYYHLANSQQLHFTTDIDRISPEILEKEIITANNKAVIAWKTSEPVSTVVRHGTNPNNLDRSISAKRYDFWYVAELDNLLPGKTYYFKIESKDRRGNTPPSSQTSGRFNTWSISKVEVSDVTGHEATLSWRTSVATDSIIEYGTSRNLGRRSGRISESTSHNVRLVNLESNATYYARIVLTKGETTSTSDIFTFKTLDASAGYPTDPVVVTPGFNSNFDLSAFNFKDFPPDDIEASQSGEEASSGAVLASTDSPLQSIAGNYEKFVATYPWVAWLWLPIIILLATILAVWLLLRHEQRMKKIRLIKPRD